MDGAGSSSCRREDSDDDCELLALADACESPECARNVEWRLCRDGGRWLPCCCYCRQHCITAFLSSLSLWCLLETSYLCISTHCMESDMLVVQLITNSRGVELRLNYMDFVCFR